MKAVVVRRIGAYGLEELPVPEPGRSEVLIKVEVAGVCRTDLKLIKNGHRDLLLPCIPGEEVVGVILKRGSEVEGLEEGERVFVYPGTSCKECGNCKKGAENLCLEMRIMGFHRPGGFAQYLVAPAASVIPIPEGLVLEHAVLAEPLSCCLNALELARLGKEETIGIWGAGPAGNLLQRASMALEGIPTLIEPDPDRQRRAGAMGDPSGQFFDVCIVAVGSAAAYRQALECLAPRGRLVIFSGLLKEENTLSLDLNRIHYLEQGIVGAYGFSFRHGVQAIKWLSEGRVKVGDLISHRFGLGEVGQALDVVESRKGMKVLIYPNS